MFKSYYYLTKPGIVYSNTLTAIAGFFLAARGHIDILLFLAMVFGLAFVIASACVFNNYMDRGIDSKMLRTRKRALVTKKIPERNALIFGSALATSGFSLLFFHTNPLTAFIAFVGFFFYLVMYGIYKRRSENGTLVGSISGAVPPVVGYCAVTNQFDLAALMLFVILVIWQMPHFYAIALFRTDDYRAAGIPVLPIKRGIQQTKMQILFYIIAFIIVVSSLTYFRYTGFSYLLILLTVSIIWLGLAIRGFTVDQTHKWARKMFFFSLIVIVLFSGMLIVNEWLP